MGVARKNPDRDWVNQLLTRRGYAHVAALSDEAANELLAKHRKEVREKMRERRRLHREANPLPEKAPVTEKECTACLVTKALDQFPTFQRNGTPVYEANCIPCKRERNIIRMRAQRVAVLTHYSGGTPKCACCSEDNLEFLAIDHIHGGGSQQRKTIKGSWWSWLRRNGYPSGFRVLCHNCNQSLGCYGYCPHQDGRGILDQAFASYDPNKPSESYKLTDEQVDSIRLRAAAGESQAKLATEFKTSRANVCLIVGGKSRKPMPVCTNARPPVAA